MKALQTNKFTFALIVLIRIMVYKKFIFGKGLYLYTPSHCQLDVTEKRVIFLLKYIYNDDLVKNTLFSIIYVVHVSYEFMLTTHNHP